MTNNFLPFSVPDIGSEEINAVTETLRSGWVTTGQKTKQFESLFTDFLGGEVQSVAVNSATAGLHLALEALGIGPGDEVIAPTMTFTATVEVVRYLGADPVIVDVDPYTLNIDPDMIRSSISSRTKAIVPVHFGGLACNMDEIIDIAREYDLRVVEDAAHALPSTFNGIYVGRLPSDITVFSFYANKTITTGEGGMAVTSNPELADRMRIMRLHGINRDAFDRFVSNSPSWYYEIVAPGFKYNLTDIASSIGIEQLKKLPSFSLRRNQLAARYFSSLADLPLVLPARPLSGDIHAWHLFVIRILDSSIIDRDSLINELSQHGIGTSVHYIPLHRHPYWRDRYGLERLNYPVAENAFKNMLSIPLYTKMSDSDQDKVVSVLTKIFS